MNSGQSLGVEPVWLALVAYHPQSWSFVMPSLPQHEILGSTLIRNKFKMECTPAKKGEWVDVVIVIVKYTHIWLLCMSSSSAFGT